MRQDQALTASQPEPPRRTSGGALSPLPRRELGRGILALLILLRIYVILAVPIVGYAFVRAILAHH